MEMLINPIERSKREFIKAIRLCGSLQRLAEKTGTTRQRLNYWRAKDNLMSYNMAIKIFNATEGRVNLYCLQPDLANEAKKFLELFLKQSCQLCPMNKKTATPNSTKKTSEKTKK